MENALIEAEIDREFIEKRTKLISFSEKLKRYCGKNIHEYTISEINSHIKLIKQFLKTNQGIESLINDLESIEGDVLATDFI